MHSSIQDNPAHQRTRQATLAVAAAVVLGSFLMFAGSHNRQVGDSRYSILLAQNLISHGDFDLARYRLVDPGQSDYRLERVGNHVYYAFPIGSSVLSVPLVAALNLTGRTPFGADGRYDWQREEDLNVLLAHWLMAVFVGVLFLTARLRLPVGWSLTLALAVGFGTQVWSTLSRGLWSDTWGVLLVGLGVYLVVRSEVTKRSANGAFLGALAGAAYVCRPTNAIAVIGFAVYLSPLRRSVVWFLVTSAAIGTALVAYSTIDLGVFLPSYFGPGRIAFRGGLAPLAANLVSPSRGLLVCVPVVLAVALLLLRFWRFVQPSRLTAISCWLVLFYVLAVSGFESTGGHSFGCRLLAGLVPWIALLGIVALDATRTALATGRVPRPEVGAVFGLSAMLCVASIAINAVGAISRASARWNVIPVNVDQEPARVWQWRQPQFLAPLLDPPGPFRRIPPERLDMSAAAADPYLGRGWDYATGDVRWTDGTLATFRFLADPGAPATMIIDLKPYLGEGRLKMQRMIASLNGGPLGTWTVDRDGFVPITIAIPGADVSRDNVLRLELPDAASPHAVQPHSGDRRELGVAVRTIGWSQDSRS